MPTKDEPECPYRADDACFRCIEMGKICDQAIELDDEDPGADYPEAKDITKELDKMMQDMLNGKEHKEGLPLASENEEYSIDA